MKAIQLNKYNKNLSVEVNEIPIPKVNDNEVLIQVAYAAINPLENLTISGKVRLIQDYQKPFTLGNELTGKISKIGSGIKNFSIGDAVYTRLPVEKIGAFADYVTVDAKYISKLSNNLNFKTGAAAALTGLTAYQALTEELNIEPGKTLFIPGGSGSFGQMAVPIAKSLGLKVIVSGSPRLKEQFIAKGVDQYLDYKQENYWDVLTDVDYIIDTLGPHEFDKELSVIKHGGTLVSLINSPNKHFAEKNGYSKLKTILFSLAGKKFDKKAHSKGINYRFVYVRADGNQLSTLTQMIERENIIPDIDSKIFTVNEVNEALDYVFNHHTNGKVLLQFDDMEDATSE
ncbi:NADP-dependent oxidoreductase [Staphylococcus edaphicus]|uniref:Oxidoreductase n=1 Tax=Staphylococcus edaphicus TaxID=1955013 RepID=A0A2C6WPU7_9STAP|nr:NADP-dependent oxidoreductase [Staphylococcus edaphicus]PHK50105.1 oxidoreductase [Staphylococcus edaphicus]UQW81599.1 NADP-dependent oxidoreductase [Staphylococcus edaphicus]